MSSFGMAPKVPWVKSLVMEVNGTLCSALFIGTISLLLVVPLVQFTYGVEQMELHVSDTSPELIVLESTIQEICTPEILKEEFSAGNYQVVNLLWKNKFIMQPQLIKLIQEFCQSISVHKRTCSFAPTVHQFTKSLESKPRQSWDPIAKANYGPKHGHLTQRNLSQEAMIWL